MKRRAAFAFACVALAGAGNAGAQQLTRIDVAASRAALSNGSEDWRETSVALSAALTPAWTGIVRFEHSERFGVSDTYVEVRGERGRGRRIAYAAVGAAPDAHFRPRWAIKAGLAQPLDESWALLGDVDVSGFAFEDVVSVRLGVERRFNLANASAQVFAIAAASEAASAAGYGWRLEAQATPRLRLRAGFADAPETSDGSIMPVTAWSLAGMFDLSDAVSVRMDLTAEERGRFRRDELAFGAAWRF